MYQVVEYVPSSTNCARYIVENMQVIQNGPGSTEYAR